jgi:RNA polymerase sigma factor (sigma-70 family)
MLEARLADEVVVFVSHCWVDAVPTGNRIQISNLKDKSAMDVSVRVALHLQDFEDVDARALFSDQPPRPDDFEIFAKAFRERLIRIIQRRLGVSRTVAEEIAQAALLAVWRQISNGNMPRDPFSYLMTVVIHLAIAYRRAEQQMLPSAAIYDVPDGSAEFAFRRAELRADVERAMKTLPPRMREILFLHLADVSDDEIARRLGIGKGAVGTQLTRTRERMRSLLSDWGTE